MCEFVNTSCIQYLAKKDIDLPVGSLDILSSSTYKIRRLFYKNKNTFYYIVKNTNFDKDSFNHSEQSAIITLLELDASVLPEQLNLKYFSGNLINNFIEYNSRTESFEKATEWILNNRNFPFEKLSTFSWDRLIYVCNLQGSIELLRKRFFKSFSNISNKSIIRRVLTEDQQTIPMITTEMLESSCLSVKDFALILSRNTDILPSVSRSVKEWVIAELTVELLTGHSKTSKVLNNALEKVKRSIEHE